MKVYGDIYYFSLPCHPHGTNVLVTLRKLFTCSFQIVGPLCSSQGTYYFILPLYEGLSLLATDNLTCTIHQHHIQVYNLVDNHEFICHAFHIEDNTWTWQGTERLSLHVSTPTEAEWDPSLSLISWETKRTINDLFCTSNDAVPYTEHFLEKKEIYYARIPNSTSREKLVEWVTAGNVCPAKCVVGPVAIDETESYYVVFHVDERLKNTDFSFGNVVFTRLQHFEDDTNIDIRNRAEEEALFLNTCPPSVLRRPVQSENGKKCFTLCVRSYWPVAAWDMCLYHIFRLKYYDQRNIAQQHAESMQTMKSGNADLRTTISNQATAIHELQVTTRTILATKNELLKLKKKNHTLEESVQQLKYDNKKLRLTDKKLNKDNQVLKKWKDDFHILQDKYDKLTASYKKVETMRNELQRKYTDLEESYDTVRQQKKSISQSMATYKQKWKSEQNVSKKFKKCLRSDAWKSVRNLLHVSDNDIVEQAIEGLSKIETYRVKHKRKRSYMDFIAHLLEIHNGSSEEICKLVRTQVELEAQLEQEKKAKTISGEQVAKLQEKILRVEKEYNELKKSASVEQLRCLKQEHMDELKRLDSGAVLDELKHLRKKQQDTKVFLEKTQKAIKQHEKVRDYLQEKITEEHKRKQIQIRTYQKEIFYADSQLFTIRSIFASLLDKFETKEWKNWIRIVTDNLIDSHEDIPQQILTDISNQFALYLINRNFVLNYKNAKQHITDTVQLVDWDTMKQSSVGCKEMVQTVVNQVLYDDEEQKEHKEGNHVPPSAEQEPNVTLKVHNLMCCTLYCVPANTGTSLGEFKQWFAEKEGMDPTLPYCWLSIRNNKTVSLCQDHLKLGEYAEEKKMSITLYLIYADNFKF